MAELLQQPDIAEAIKSLDSSNFTIVGADPTTEAEFNERVTFFTDGNAQTKKSSPVTWSQVQTKYNELNVLYTNNSYARTRIAQYDTINEQLDILWHDIDAGKLGADAKTGAWYTSVKKVKDDNPKS
tara:strand:- start:572 stop:952 length:381 start_codon:yes stop_codon:yes gene_type:complete